LICQKQKCLLSVALYTGSDWATRCPAFFGTFTQPHGAVKLA